MGPEWTFVKIYVRGFAVFEQQEAHVNSQIELVCVTPTQPLHALTNMTHITPTHQASTTPNPHPLPSFDQSCPGLDWKFNHISLSLPPETLYKCSMKRYFFLICPTRSLFLFLFRFPFYHFISMDFSFRSLKKKTFSALTEPVFSVKFSDIYIESPPPVFHSSFSNHDSWTLIYMRICHMFLTSCSTRGKVGQYIIYRGWFFSNEWETFFVAV